MKRFDTREYVSVLRELTNAGEEVNLRIAGNSMSPFLIHGRDSIRFRAPSRPFRRGDMVFYQRTNGQFVMHRILFVRPEGCYIVGDAQQEIEGPIRPEQIFAIITSVCRKGKWIDETDFCWKFFAGPWLALLPLRRALMRGYILLRRRRG